VPNAPAIQSFAVAQDRDGRWLCFGGRTAGLHGQQNDGQTPPPLSNFENINDRVWVIDVAHAQATSRALADLNLPADMAASLTVTGAQYVQVQDKLYIVGGYGFSADHSFMRTYRQLTVVDVDATVDAILNGRAVGDHIRQSGPDEYLRVTGGELRNLDGVFFLVFGQSFDFAYTPTSSGRYTHQVRPFQVTDDGKSVAIVKGVAVGSAASDPEFRRRDLNLVPIIRANGRLGLTVFGGVFTPARGAWYRPIDIDSQGGSSQVSLWADGFAQQLCQYNCAVLPIRQVSTNTMFTVFFGGISQVCFQQNTFKSDNGLPFVDHVGCIGRRAGSAKEWLVGQGGSTGQPSPLKLPGLLGTAARFLPFQTGSGSAPFDRGMLELDKVQTDLTVGFIYGGIAAVRGNNGPTTASSRMFEVHLSPQPSSAIAVPTVISITPQTPSPQSR
jgi:hypothetical protein